jgi:hypothetical protein
METVFYSEKSVNLLTAANFQIIHNNIPLQFSNNTGVKFMFLAAKFTAARASAQAEIGVVNAAGRHHTSRLTALLWP